MTEIKQVEAHNLSSSLLESRTEFLLGNSLLRDELSPSVRSYADNLCSQIKQEFNNQNITSLSEMEKAIKEGDMPIAQIIKIQQLIDRLSNIATIGEIPQEEKENIEQQLMECLKPVIDEWSGFRKSEDYKKVELTLVEATDLSAEFLKPKIDSLPDLPYDILINDENFMQRVMEKIYILIDKEGGKDLGLLVSLIINRSLRGISEEELSKVHQILDMTNFYQYIKYLGYKFPGGNLTIKGGTGIYTALKMEGGKIFIEKAGSVTGAFMTGGELIINDGGIAVGKGMKGGKITIKEASTDLGEYMENGFIEAEEAGNRTGNKIKGGLIIVKSAGDCLGSAMTEGTIKANKAERLVGIDMHGGKIYVEECSSISSDRDGGEVYLKGNKYSS